jgi:hypothetical protein
VALVAVATAAGPLHFSGRNGAPLLLGKTRPTESAEWADALTVIITVAPGEELQLTTVSGGAGRPPAMLQTFVFPLTVHPALTDRTAAAAEPVRLTHWALPAAASPSFCTQGVGGAENAPFFSRHFPYKNDHLTKPGSGQTSES